MTPAPFWDVRVEVPDISVYDFRQFPGLVAINLHPPASGPEVAAALARMEANRRCRRPSRSTGAAGARGGSAETAGGCLTYKEALSIARKAFEIGVDEWRYRYAINLNGERKRYRR